MFEFVEITDGVTSVELTDMSNYALVSYAPTIAHLRNNELATVVYDDVVDSQTFHTIGDRAADALVAADKVSILLDQAERWQRGEIGVSAVRLRVKTQGSVLPILEAALTGRPANSQAGALALQVKQDQNFCKFISENASIQFGRRGQWLGKQETAANATPTTWGTPQSVAFATALSVLSPHNLNLAVPSGAVANGGYLLTAANPASIVVQQAEALSLSSSPTAGTMTVVADSANFARGGSVVRFIPTSTADIGSLFPPGAVTLPRNCVAFAAVRPRTTSDPFTISTTLFNSALGESATAVVPYAPRFTAGPQPEIIQLGTFPSQTSFTNFNIQLQTTNMTSTPRLDIDAIWFVEQSPETAIIGVGSPDVGDLGFTAAGTLRLDQRLLSQPVGWIYRDDAGFTAAPIQSRSYTGNLAVVAKSPGMTVCLVTTSGGRWNGVNPAGTTAATHTLSVTRQLGYLTPQ